MARSLVSPQFRLPTFPGDMNPSGGYVVAALGDSISDNGVSDTFFSAANFRTIQGNTNYLSWLRFLSHQRVYHPISHNLGIAGETLSQIAARAGQLFNLNPQPHMVIFQGGTNDLGPGTPLAQMQSKFIEVAKMVLQAGMMLVVFPILPREGITAAQYQRMNEYNNWLRRWVQEVGTRGVVFVDPNPYLTNYADVDGDPIAGHFHDGLHTSATGAYWLGKAIYDAIERYLPPFSVVGMHPRDYFNETTNPTGNIIRSGTTNQGRMAGTGGTATSVGGFTASGDIAPGWTLTRGAGGSATCTGVGAKQNPRTDGPNSGERQSLAFAVTVAGGTAEVFTFRWTGLSIGAGDVKVGDIIYATAKVEIAANAIGLAAVEYQFSEFGSPNSGVLTQEMSRITGETLLLPTIAVPIVGSIRTPDHLVREGNTTINNGFNIYMDTTVASAGATIIISDVAIRKKLGV